MPHRLGRLLSLLLSLLLLAACRSLPRVPAGNVPDAGGTRDLAPPPAGASPVAPVATALLPAGPYPPTVIDFSPGAGRVIGTDAVLTWRFSEPMDQQSVSDGLRIAPTIAGVIPESARGTPESARGTPESARGTPESARGTPESARGPVWADTQTVSFHAEGLAPGTRYEVHLEGVQSAAGLPLSGNRTFVFSTLAPLKVISVSPSDGEEGLRTDVAVRVTFNRPVVGPECVGHRTSAGEDCPRLPLVISPDVAGDGVWVHSTVYQFTARDGLAARAVYQVTLKPGFVSLDGDTVTGPTTWSFSTASPRIVAQWPTVGQPDVPLSATIRITFSTPMDQVLTGGAFSLATEAGSAVAGTSLWEDNGAALKFTPAEPLALGTTYRVRVGERARAASSTPLENPQAWGFRTVPYPRVVGQTPENGARGVPVDTPLQLTFEGAIDAQSLASAVEISPAVSSAGVYGVFDPSSGVYSLVWAREPRTEYCVTLGGVEQAGADAGEAAGLAPTGVLLQGVIADIYGHPLVSPPPLCFTTGDWPPLLELAGEGGGVTLDASRPAVLHFATRNVNRADFVLARISSTALMQRRYGEGEVLRQWRETFDTELNVTELVTVSLPRTAGALPTGLYRVSWQMPDSGQAGQTVTFAVVDTHLTVKLSVQDGLAWVTSLSSEVPVSRAAVRLIDEEGLLIAGGTTDGDGLASLSTTNLRGPARPVAVVVGEPGSPGFGFVLASWQGEASPGSFDIVTDTGPVVPYRVFVQTDRTAYGQGDRVEIAGWARSPVGPRFALPSAGELVSLHLRNPYWQTIHSGAVRTTETGSFAASLLLPEDAVPGTYRLDVVSHNPEAGAGDVELLASASLRVVDSRQPDFSITVRAADPEVVAGGTVRYAIDVNTQAGGVAADTDVAWSVVAEPYTAADRFLGVEGGGWSWGSAPGVARVVLQEQWVRTDADGHVRVELPAVPAALGGGAATGAQRWILRAAVLDERGARITASDSVVVHESALYVGVRPRVRVVQPRERVMVDLLAVHSDGSPAGGQALRVRLLRRSWARPETYGAAWSFGDAVVTTQAVTTGADGTASVGFTLAQGGAYLVVADGVDAERRATRSEADLWVSGGGEVAGPQAGPRSLTLLADGASHGHCTDRRYRVGDVARVLVPTTFVGPYQILMTVERDGLLRVERYSRDTPNPILTVPIEEGYAPNVYVSVVAVQSGTETEPAQVQAGYLNLCVDTTGQQLAVQVTADRAAYKPGETATIVIRTLDSEGLPVDADVTMSLVKAGESTPALFRRPFPSLWTAFWGHKPLGVRMGDTLLVSMDRGKGALTDLAQRVRSLEPGGGSGAGFEDTAGLTETAEGDIDQGVRETAFWSGLLRTGPEGRIEVPVELPDSVTTWQVVVRAITATTDVGEADLRLEVTHPLHVQALAPRFVVVGDRTELVAQVANTTDEDLLTDVRIETGDRLVLVSPEDQQQVLIPFRSRRELRWTVEVVEGREDGAHARFVARSGDTEAIAVVSDSATGSPGLPVHRLVARDSPAISGVLIGAGTRLETLMIPEASAEGTALTLRIEVSPPAPLYEVYSQPERSHVDTTDAWASRLLHAAASYEALAGAGDVQREELDAVQLITVRTANDALDRIYGRQTADGGWGWWHTGSDLHISSYAVYAMLRAKAAGFDVNAQVMASGLRYIFESLDGGVTADVRTPHAAFAVYVLSYAGVAWPPGAASRLYSERASLGVEGAGFLALALGTVDASDTRVRTLVNELTALAVRSETGAYWPLAGRRDWATQRQVTAVGMMALARFSPQDSLLPEVARWLMLNRGPARSGAGYEPAWVTTALGDYLAGADRHETLDTWQVRLNGTLLGDAASETLPGGAAWSGTVTLDVDAGVLRSGLNVVEVTRGAGEVPLYYSLHVDQALPLGAAGDGFVGETRGVVLDREYCHVEASGGDRSARPHAPCRRAEVVQVGDAIEVRLTVAVPETRHFLVLDDPYPAGFELLRPDEPGRVWAPEFDRHELRDAAARFYTQELPAGTYQVIYRLRAAVPGIYSALPGSAEELYFPEIWGSTPVHTIAIQMPVD